MAPDKQPWYQSSGATLAAGLAGLALVAGLVMAVVQMSSRWGTTDSDTVLPPGTHLPDVPHFNATTGTGSSTSYTTSVQLSTTDIGLPSETPSSSTTSSSASPTPESPTSSTSSTAVAPTFPGTFPTRVTHPPGPRLVPGRPSG